MFSTYSVMGIMMSLLEPLVAAVVVVLEWIHDDRLD
jgi:hypothetical protein